MKTLRSGCRQQVRIALVLGFCALNVPEPEIRADQFRIDTMVFVQGSSEAICQATTLVQDERVYDHLRGAQEEVTILDMNAKRILILDVGRRWKVELPFADLDQFVQTAIQAARSSPPYVQFAASPKFETLVDKNDTVIRLIGSRISYRVETHRAPTARVSEQFQQFADWSAKVNTLRPGLPPIARLELNKKLAQRQRIPTLVDCTIQINDRDAKVLQSRHEYTWSLAAGDLAQIDNYDAWSRDFESQRLQRVLQPDATRSPISQD